MDSDCKEHFDHKNKATLTVESYECDVDAAEYCVKTTGVWGGMDAPLHALLQLNKNHFYIVNNV